MKTELVRYTCDNCKNTVTVPLGGTYVGTPLHHDWIRMYVLVQPIDLQKTKVHFCKASCAIAYLERNYLV